MAKQKITVKVVAHNKVPLHQIYYGKFFSSDMFGKEELFIALPNYKNQEISCVSIASTQSFTIERDQLVVPVDVDIRYYPTPNFEYEEPGPGMG